MLVSQFAYQRGLSRELLMKPSPFITLARLSTIPDTVSSNGEFTLVEFPIPSYVHLLKKGATGHGETGLRVRVTPPEMLVSQFAYQRGLSRELLMKLLQFEIAV